MLWRPTLHKKQNSRTQKFANLPCALRHGYLYCTDVCIQSTGLLNESMKRVGLTAFAQPLTLNSLLHRNNLRQSRTWCKSLPHKHSFRGTFCLETEYNCANFKPGIKGNKNPRNITKSLVHKASDLAFTCCYVAQYLQCCFLGFRDAVDVNIRQDWIMYPYFGA